MNRIWLFLLFYISISGNPIFAQNQTLRSSVILASFSERFLGLQNDLRPSNKEMANFSMSYDLYNLSSQLAINYDRYKKFNLDESYFQYTKGIATYGIGAINRHWSFSENTSLILSHNARPSKSIYLKLKNKFGYHWLPPKADWSFELFNGFIEASQNKKSMLLGARAIFSPIEGLNIEFAQTSQWGGKEYSSGLSALGSALLFDTNKGKNANINKMAGFGISYMFPKNIFPLRIYGQAIGEDEAGNLPSCYAYLAGLEWSNTKTRYPITFGIEAIDTRIKTTTHGYCGPNTMYSNSTYNYTNYGNTMGTSIDTEGYSLELFGQSQISQKIDIKFSSKSVVINDASWSNHRLSSNRQSGLISSLGVNWKNNDLKFSGNIYFQDFILDNANIKDNYGIGFSSKIFF
jgi:hypothetical protein